MSATAELERPTTEKKINAKEEKNDRTNSIAANRERQVTVEQADKQEANTPEGVERTRTGKVFVPVVDIYETPDEIVLVADMPGVDEESVDVTLEKNVLTIYGRVEPNYPSSYSLTYSEYRIGDYQRSFTIANTIDWEHISGTVSKGVLRLKMPKAGPAKTRKIEVKAATSDSGK